MAAALCTDSATQREHNLMVNRLHDEIGEKKTEEMRQLLRPELKKNLDKFDVRTILNELTNKSVIHVGKYSYLKQVLSDIHLERLIDIVERAEKNIETFLGSNTAEETVHGESQENGEGPKRKRTDTSEFNSERYADLELKLELNKIERDKQANEVILQIAQKALTDEVLQNTRKRKRILNDLLEFKSKLVGPIRTGSILLTVRFYSLEDLTYFWSKYKDGTVTAALSDILLSDKILEISKKNHVEFYITCDISEDAYIEACRILRSEDEAPDSVDAVTRMSNTDDTQGKEAMEKESSQEQVELKTIEEVKFDASGDDLVEEAETRSPMKVVQKRPTLHTRKSVQESITGHPISREQEPMRFGGPEAEAMQKELENEPRELARIEEASTERTITGEQEPMSSDAFLESSVKLENELCELVQNAEEASKKLHSLADEIDEFFKKCNRGKIAGSAAALVGFPLMAVGFGLSFVTFGASLGLTIAGAALSSAGGITAGGSGLAEHFITKSKCREAQEAVDVVIEKIEAYKETLEKLENMSPSSDSISAPIHTGTFASNVAKGVGTEALGRGLAAGVMYTDSATATALIKGFVWPYNIYTLVTSSVKEYRRTKSPQANKIRELAIEMHCLAQEWNAVLNPED